VDFPLMLALPGTSVPHLAAATRYPETQANSRQCSGGYAVHDLDEPSLREIVENRIGLGLKRPGMG